MTTRLGLQWSMGAAGPVFAAMDMPQSWPDLAACAEVDGEVFFPEKGGSTWDGKRVCRGCPVRADCLTYALEHDERFGIWGGLSEPQRRQFLRQSGGVITPALIAEAIRRQDEKVCADCGVTKALEAFRRDGTKADGHGSRCIECLSVEAAA